jgi:UDP-N-acetylmuramoylalanine--D-glutamate ligase
MKRDNILILGSGVSALGAAKLAKKLNYNVRVSSKYEIGEFEKTTFSDLGIEFEEFRHSKSNISWANFIIKSPGIKSDIPFLKQATKEGVLVLSEIEFAYRNTNAKIIAITGTNGKTTTSTLLWYILRNAGLNVGLAGNIGYSFSESIIQDSYDYYVLELSSFQLEDIYDFKPHISVILNIEHDHLDRYNKRFADYISWSLGHK